ncbi:MAG: transporter substrate-binding domain-containing protein [Desulfobulbaceae bacterium]|nr:transporter substrate-binding domain-containing protein [Desulfobulbaceae bacterium]
MKRSIFFFAIGALLLEFLVPPVLPAQPSLVLNTAGRQPLHRPDQTGIIDRLLREAFGRIGIRVVIQHLPPERALLNANAGIEDGEAARVGGLSATYPNLIQVEEKVFTTDFVAFTNHRALPIRNWKDLQPYDVAIVRGHKISEKNVTGTRSLIKAENTELLFGLLKNNRADVVVCERIFGLAAAKDAGIAGVRVLEPPLARLDFFVYLHKKHAAMVPKLAKALKEMRADGSYRRIRDAAPEGAAQSSEQQR